MLTRRVSQNSAKWAKGSFCGENYYTGCNDTRDDRIAFAAVRETNFARSLMRPRIDNRLGQFNNAPTLHRVFVAHLQAFSV